MMNTNKYLPKELQKHIKSFLIDDKGKHKIKFNKVMNNIKYLKDSYDEGVSVGQLFLNCNDPDANDEWFEWGRPPMRYEEFISEIIYSTLLYKECCEYSYLIHNFIKMKRIGRISIDRNRVRFIDSDSDSD